MSKDIFVMADGTVLVNVHTQDQCAGQYCCMHNQSDHHMRQWRGQWDSTFKQMWRKCPHDLEHPDPDDLQFSRRTYGDADVAAAWLHSCDGCCQPPVMSPEAIRAKVIEAIVAMEASASPALPPRLDYVADGGRLVEHEPVWRPAVLRTNWDGDTRPGFICIHELENGMGQCGSNVFRIEDAIGTHSCWVPS